MQQHNFVLNCWVTQISIPVESPLPWCLCMICFGPSFILKTYVKWCSFCVATTDAISFGLSLTAISRNIVENGTSVCQIAEMSAEVRNQKMSPTDPPKKKWGNKNLPFGPRPAWPKGQPGTSALHQIPRFCHPALLLLLGHASSSNMHVSHFCCKDWRPKGPPISLSAETPAKKFTKKLAKRPTQKLAKPTKLPLINRKPVGESVEPNRWIKRCQIIQNVQDGAPQKHVFLRKAWKIHV